MTAYLETNTIWENESKQIQRLHNTQHLPHNTNQNQANWLKIMSYDSTFA